MTEETRLLVEQRKLAAMRDRITEESYLTVKEVAKRWGVSRTTVEMLPLEILPFVNLTPYSKRANRRYHPDEIRAAEVRLRGLEIARSEARSEAYLGELRSLMVKRDAAVLGAAMETS